MISWSQLTISSSVARTRRRPFQSPRRPRSNVLALLLVLVVVLGAMVVSVQPKEIEATKEWQVVGDNDTIPAGVHVRMDLSTGEKMVKLMDEDVDRETMVAVVDPDGSISASRSDGTGQAVVADADDGSASGGNNYDFDMMHRALSKLPPDEQTRIGGLPQLPQGGISDMTPEQRRLFEERMTTIWTQRQEELRNVQEELLMDLPEVLKDRIKRIQLYLDNPIEHLLDIVNGVYVETSQTTTDDEDGHMIVTHILSVLEDLEYQLNDLDMARDFHTLGGWPLLASLLSPEAHLYTGNSTSSSSLSELAVETKDLASQVQARAAWVVGTAVKNTEEFFPYATEEVMVRGRRTTALEMLLRGWEEADSDDVKLRQKMLYGMGSMLRGNQIAQLHFLKLKGPKAFAKALEPRGQILPDKLKKRMLAIVGDVVHDALIRVKSSSTPRDDRAIVKAFADLKSICNSVVDGLSNSSLRETAFRATVPLAGNCRSWNKKQVLSKVNNALEALERGSLDEEQLTEYRSMAETIRLVLQ